MFTIESLLDIASQANAEMAAARAAPIWNYETYHRAEQKGDAALVCAAWLEKAGLAEVTTVGPFGDEPDYQRGDRVRVKKGAIIRSTKTSLCRTASRTFVVRVFDHQKGWAGMEWGESEVRNAKVEWVGAGGYWCWTDSNNVEPFVA
jgi:hypothetical protein